MRRYQCVAECVENVSAITLFDIMGRADVGKVVVWVSHIESGDEEIECLSRGMFVNRAERCHLCFAVEGEP